MNQDTSPLFIDTPAQLAQFCLEIADASWLAMDTEFLREKTYFPKFCLLQIATDRTVACIDPLALDNLAPLTEIIYSPHIVKVWHSARQDLEIFYRLYGKLPMPIFDTQIAAPMIGLAEQISYAALVSEILGVHLSKSHSRTDWSRRPLSPEQLRYAADDVIYLGKAYQQIRSRLDQLERNQWLDQEFADLGRPDAYDSPPASAWQKVNGAYQLKGKALSVLQVLAAWREQTARDQDLPRGWLLKDEVLFDLARQQPKDPDALKSLRGLDERIVKRHGTTLCQLIQQASNHPPVTPDYRARTVKKSPEQEALLDVLMAVVRIRAAQNKLNPSVLASRKDLEHMLDGNDESRLMHGWRQKMAGEELAAVLRGELGLKITEGNLTLIAHA